MQKAGPGARLGAKSGARTRLAGVPGENAQVAHGRPRSSKLQRRAMGPLESKEAGGMHAAGHHSSVALEEPPISKTH